MKKAVFIVVTFVVLALLAIPSRCDAVFNSSVFFYRSSYTETQDSRVLISSEGILAFGGFSDTTQTASTTPNGGLLYIYNSQVFGPTTSTVTVVGCGELAQAETFVPVQLSSGLMYTKTGDCKASIFWDVLQRNLSVLPRRVN